MSPNPTLSTCASFSPWLHAFMDGELAPTHIASLEAHLAGCAACATELAQLRTVRAALLNSGPGPALPAGLAARIRRAAQEVASAQHGPGSCLPANAAARRAWGLDDAGTAPRALHRAAQALHERELPMDSTSAEALLYSMLPGAIVPTAVGEAALVGARAVTAGAHPAVLVAYADGDTRVSVLLAAFGPARAQIAYAVCADTEDAAVHALSAWADVVRTHATFEGAPGSS